MLIPRTLSLAARLAASSAWASTLVLPGLWLLIDGPQTISIPLSIRVPAGLSAVAAGLLIFMVGVADRLFPAVHRGELTWRIELATLAVFLLAILLALILTLSRGA